MIDNIEQIIKSKELPQILFMFGEEEFLLDEAYNKLITHLLKKDPSKSDFEIFNGEADSIDRVISSCFAYPFIAPNRIVVLNNCEKLFSGRAKKIDEKSALTKYLKSTQPSTIFIVKASLKKLNGLSAKFRSKRNKTQAEKIINNAGFPYSIFLSKFDWIEFPRVYENQLSSWVKKRFNYFGKDIDATAAELLVTHTNPNLRDLSNEIDKLLIYISGRSKVTIDDIHFMTGVNRDYNVFELQRSIGRRDLTNSIVILENMLSSDRKEMLILTVLTNYFITLWKLIEESRKSSDKYKLAGVLRVNPMFVGEYLNALRLYSQQEINRAFGLLLEADVVLKTTSTDSIYIMEKLLIEIISKRV